MVMINGLAVDHNECNELISYKVPVGLNAEVPLANGRVGESTWEVLSPYMLYYRVQYCTGEMETMMTSYGIVTHITGPLWGESTSNWWIPLTKDQ